jgi:hypothetical protein
MVQGRARQEPDRRVRVVAVKRAMMRMVLRLRTRESKGVEERASRPGRDKFRPATTGACKPPHSKAAAE